MMLVSLDFDHMVSNWRTPEPMMNRPLNAL